MITAMSAGTSFSSDKNFEQARAAYDAGDYVHAEAIWRELAEAGDIDAMFTLGALLFEGPGNIPVDYVESYQWSLKASELGHPDAQYNLGNAYQKGLGVVQSDEQAAYWWQRSAAQGTPKAAYNLGVQYMYGRGVPMDYELALKSFQFAAARGHLSSRKLLLGWNLDIPEVVDTESVAVAGQVSDAGDGVNSDAVAATGDSAVSGKLTASEALTDKVESVVSVDTDSDKPRPGLAVETATAAIRPSITPVVTQTPPETVQEDQDTELAVMTAPAEPMDSVSAETGEAVVDPGSRVDVGQQSIDSGFPTFVSGESRILQVPKERFTLQLTAMSKPELVDDFISQHQLSGNLYRYRYHRNTQTFYALAIGNFLSREEAITFRDRLAQARPNRKSWQNPWLRRCSDIQDLIRVAQKAEQL